MLTGGGPGNSTTFLSQFLTQKAVGQFDLGPAAAAGNMVWLRFPAERTLYYVNDKRV